MVAPEVAPNVSARGADDVDMGDEVAQRGVSDAESVGSDELREPQTTEQPIRSNVEDDPFTRKSRDSRDSRRDSRRNSHVIHT